MRICVPCRYDVPDWIGHDVVNQLCDGSGICAGTIAAVRAELNDPFHCAQVGLGKDTKATFTLGFTKSNELFVGRLASERLPPCRVQYAAGGEHWACTEALSRAGLRIATAIMVATEGLTAASSPDSSG